MSILMTDPGFGRGATLGVKTAEQGQSVVGTLKAFTDADPRTTGGGVVLSNRPVHCIAARNTSGAPLLPGAIVQFKATALLEEVDGSAGAAVGLLGVVDEYLPATGVADKDVCWVVVEGPTAIVTAASLAAGAALTVADGEAVAGDEVSAPEAVIGFALKAPADGKVRAVVKL